MKKRTYDFPGLPKDAAGIVFYADGSVSANIPKLDDDSDVEMDSPTGFATICMLLVNPAFVAERRALWDRAMLGPVKVISEHVLVESHIDGKLSGYEFSPEVSLKDGQHLRLDYENGKATVVEKVEK